ncbi:MAG: hypothetical protein JWP49_999 [Phenylobacterium sp.]|nr:hypothetical protein [Phenylobacterium sp.]
MRPLALLAASVVAAAALPAVPAAAQIAPRPGAPVAPAAGWTGTLYKDFKFYLGYPTGTQLTEQRTTTGQAASFPVLTVFMPRAGDALFMARVADYSASTKDVDPKDVLTTAIGSSQVTGLHEIAMDAGRAWQFDYVLSGHRVRERIVVLKFRNYILRSIATPAGDFDPATDQFLQASRFVP